MKSRIYQVTVAADAPVMKLKDAAQNAGLLPFDGSEKSDLSPKKSFEVVHESRVVDPKSFWFLAPGVLVYPEAMIGEDVYESPYYSWAYDVELLSMVSETDHFWAMNTTQVFPHPNTGYVFNLKYNYPLFRLEGEAKTDLFCLEGQESTGDELLVNYRQYGLSGLTFEEFWVG
ncbi:hypothetical protein FEM03_16435 [Phragmitibacter flavus]|uniref:Uncharacterized protein n=1 Tax=Phragmitibacter flavus TaxID=2576071 RepID=A0A5R8KBB5_9BACT|nr:hypothetical protein [Phragmitibacter flavus]TLD69547.1 hypothetical protein FEM03_16435 [Phragmitibacter flavus]